MVDPSRAASLALAALLLVPAIAAHAAPPQPAAGTKRTGQGREEGASGQGAGGTRPGAGTGAGQGAAGGGTRPGSGSGGGAGQGAGGGAGRSTMPGVGAGGGAGQGSGGGTMPGAGPGAGQGAAGGTVPGGGGSSGASGGQDDSDDTEAQGDDGPQRDPGDPARAQQWLRLIAALNEIPAPPTAVAQAASYDGRIAPRLDALERQLEAADAVLERATEQMDEENEAGGEDALEAMLGRAAAHGAEAQARLDAQGAGRDGSGGPRPGSGGQDDAEAGAMRQRLPAAFGDFDQQAAVGLVTQHALGMALRQRGEDEEVQRLEARAEAQSNQCGDADEGCVRAVEVAHVSRLAAYKDTVYRGVTRSWTDLRDQVRTRAVPVEKGIRKLADEHRWLLGRAEHVAEGVVQSGPVRWIVGAFAVLLGESRERWQDAKDVHDRQQEAGGR